ncbi:ribose 5-phosphate isomerase A [Simkania negevensis]|uniref:Ribose-5-phosphate isomerase A n=1 Tax=Simkania negevensis (strain ATCC VR-1471 / DSM 27360 / Z) TaxID=331113 RepID=F8L7D9_SIMNZ|nr:ribose 5-phosphate isomerase A [Simkania negevensis]CCB88668.1 ribose-5-phosphate isomerase A [Simkania negevensis Z]
MDKELLKKRAGEKAAEWIEDGMLVGLGTGSTVYYFIEKLIHLCKEGLNITVVSSSIRSFEQAQKGGIPTANMNTVTQIDITIDGADEIDCQKRMIKGGGGALLREKILANSSKEMVVIVDESKVVEKLGKRALPVEILPFGYSATIEKIQVLGFRGEMRTTNEGKFYITDNGNYIYDILFQELRESPEEDHDRLIHVPGVLETGFFFNLAGRVLIGESSGNLKQLDK